MAGARAPLVVTAAALAPRLAAGPRHVLVDDPAVLSSSAARPTPAAAPQNLAYVMFTSASTGPPKGVAVEHRQVASFLAAARAIHSDDELAGVLASTSVSFDISVSEVFLALSSGGTLILVDSLLALDDLPATPAVRKVTGTPSVLSELVRRGRLPATAVTYSLVGEAATADLVRALHREPRVTRVMNNYGPTESTVYNTAAELPPDLTVTPPLGPPLANSSLYLLDEQRRPVPRGIVGEIFIGGGGVARGYLGLPELTAERFLADVVADRPGARMYRTGDLARERADGSLEFLGRADRQVKLHGCRIELGEVESALTEHPRVSESVVTVDGAGADQRLIAYVVTDAAALDVQELRGHLLDRLPRHAVPSAILALDALPRLPNGKVDRRALPAAGGAAVRSSESDGRPRSELERMVADTFAAVLRIAVDRPRRRLLRARRPLPASARGGGSSLDGAGAPPLRTAPAEASGGRRSGGGAAGRAPTRRDRAADILARRGVPVDEPDDRARAAGTADRARRAARVRRGGDRLPSRFRVRDGVVATRPLGHRRDRVRVHRHPPRPHRPDRAPVDGERALRRRGTRSTHRGGGRGGAPARRHGRGADRHSPLHHGSRSARRLGGGEDLRR